MELSERARSILLAVVTEYIETAAPVGSRTLSKRYGLDLSAASIRNVLSDLDEAGLLHQPHSSAGRIPTDRAIRLFIDMLMRLKTVTPEARAALHAKVAEFYASGDDPLGASGKLLSDLSGGAAVVARQSKARSLSQLRFIRTRPGQILAVLVFQDGTVENRFLTTAADLTDSTLERVHNLLADVIEGRSLGEIRELFARRLADERMAVDDLRRTAFELASSAVAEVSAKREMRIEGQHKLFGLPEYDSADRLKRLMVALSEKTDILGLLDKTMTAGAVTVFVGSEAGDLGGGELSLVMAPFAENGEPAGAVGVLGPTRMDYSKVVPLVDAAAAAVSDAVSGYRK